MTNQVHSVLHMSCSVQVADTHRPAHCTVCVSTLHLRDKSRVVTEACISLRCDAQNTGAMKSVPCYVSPGHASSGIHVTNYTHIHHGRHLCIVSGSTPVAHVVHQAHDVPRKPLANCAEQYTVGTRSAPRTRYAKQATGALCSEVQW